MWSCRLLKLIENLDVDGMEEVYRGCANITGLSDHCERQDEDTVSYLYSLERQFETFDITVCGIQVLLHRRQLQ